MTDTRSLRLMRLATVLVALWPRPVDAQDAARFAWGMPVEGSGPSLLALEPCSLPCIVVVRFDNTLVTSGKPLPAAAPPVVSTTLAIPDLAVAVTVRSGVGMAPDLMQVRPPPGFAAEPREVLVDDNTKGHVRVFRAPTS